MNKAAVFLLIFALFLGSAAAAAEIHFAVEKGDVKKVKTLLRKDPQQAMAMSKKKYTPLHFAAKKGNIEMAGLLIASGAKVNAPGGPEAVTPLFVAIRMNHKGMVKFLISKGADVNAKNNKGKTPLYLAEYFKRKDIADILRKKGAK